MATYLDSLTMILALVALGYYSHLVSKHRNKFNVLGLTCIALYLVAQSSWTTAWFLGDIWGRDFANYIWFLFNTSVIGLLLLAKDKFK